MMLVVGIAHQEELAARRAYERALARFSLLHRKHGPLYRPLHPDWMLSPMGDRTLVAFVALQEARRTMNAAIDRHSLWYRAYLRARRTK